MECAKDIILELKKGQAADSSKKTGEGIIHKLVNKMAKHKIMTVVVLSTISFIVLDVVLISSFVEILVR